MLSVRGFVEGEDKTVNGASCVHCFRSFLVCQRLVLVRSCVVFYEK